MSNGAKEQGFVGRNAVKLLAFGVGVPVALTAAYTWGTLAYTYSEGDRVGYLQKLSKRGWLCGTWEGELAVSSIPGSAPQVFQFSVRDDALAAQLNELQGRRVALYYEQKKGVPSSCFGDTEYFAVRVREVK